MKKIFTIVETKPSVSFYTYEVEAETEQEALELVKCGQVEPYDYTVETSYGEDSIYDVEGFEEKE